MCLLPLFIHLKEYFIEKKFALCVFLWRGFCAMLILKTCLQINHVCKSQDLDHFFWWAYWAGKTFVLFISI